MFSSKANKEKTNEAEDDKSKVYKMGCSTDRITNFINLIHHRKMKDFFRRQIKSQTIEFFNSHNIEAGNELALTKANIFSPELSGAIKNFSGETYIKLIK